MTEKGQANAQLTDPRSSGVVLLHGIARTSRSLRKVESALQACGLATLNMDYASRRKPLEALAADIHPDIAAFANAIDGPLHFVAHSMGGLLTRVYVAHYRPAKLGRVVMLGTPNGGSEIADLLQHLSIYRAFYGRPASNSPRCKTVASRRCRRRTILSASSGISTIDPIASRFILPRPNDGRVSVQSSKLVGMTDHMTVKVSHTGLVRHRVAIDQTIAFLQEGRFMAL